MDPLHVVRLAGDALDECRSRIQQELHHRRGRATDPLYKARRMLHTRSCLLTPRQQHQLADLFASDCHVALEVTWSVYQNIIDSYRDPHKIRGKALMQAEINTLTSTRVPRGLTALITLGKNAQTPSPGHPGLLRPPPHQQRPHRSHQRTPRTPTRHRPRIRQPPKLPPTLPPPLRRIPTPPTPLNAKSRLTPPANGPRCPDRSDARGL